jgi:hypothetical protein
VIVTYHELLRLNPKSAIGANELADLLAELASRNSP